MLISSVSFAEAVTLAVINVKDGDTISISVLLPPPLNDLDVRVLGIDTPEMPAKSYHETGKLSRADCVAEAELALQATEFVKALIKENGNVITIDNFKWDKYGGRINADVYIKGVLLSTLLKERGFAVDYEGFGPRHNWCD